jgi:hypothetical protein
MALKIANAAAKERAESLAAAAPDARVRAARPRDASA